MAASAYPRTRRFAPDKIEQCRLVAIELLMDCKALIVAARDSARVVEATPPKIARDLEPARMDSPANF
jgi:hypothetical protein